ncbi:RHS repeat-associated core domain-containing protein [Longimicrobium sp.]|uniref:RHS repeat-associated core domain-containing protein n=1 Tax=Longimicrobium sp. TaxID=2029185 RepID=UPI002E37C6F5|nr:RHS repeat-associated core domain-containing protein [Longimicrobium sp.]HEX6036860.1 RHS repeat-associated core domain-containing protein [Longimicrobium sp.]
MPYGSTRRSALVALAGLALLATPRAGAAAAPPDPTPAPRGPAVRGPGAGDAPSDAPVQPYLYLLATHDDNRPFASVPGRASYSTPAYYSMDAPRAATLVYTSAQVVPRALVQVSVTDVSVNQVPVSYVLRLRRPDNSYVTFVNGQTEMHYQGGTSSRVLGAQFDASSLATGAYTYTAIVDAVYPGGSFRQNTLSLRFVVLNEVASPFGAGWTVAGVHRLYVQQNGILLARGDGTAVFYEKSCATCPYTTPQGEFGTLSPDNGQYRRSFADSTREQYDGAGRLLWVRDRVGNTTSYGYDAAGRLGYIQDPVGKRLVFGYNTAGKLATITDPGGRVTQVTVNASGDLAQVVDPGNGFALRATYDAAHRLVTHQDRRGGVWTLAYHATGMLDSLQMPGVPVLRNGTEQTVRPTVRYRSVEEAVVPPAGTGTASSPAPLVLGTDLVVTDARGFSTAYRLSKWGPEQVTEPRGRVTVINYTPHGQVTYRRDPAGRVMNWWWTGQNLDSVFDATASRTLRYRYGAFNQVREISDGTFTQVLALDSRGLVQTEGLAGSSTLTRYTYDTRGRVTQVIDPQGHYTRVYYASAGAMNTDSVVGDTAGQRVSFTYDGLGRPRTLTNGGNQTASAWFDALNRDSVYVVAGDTVRYGYDGLYPDRVILPGNQVYETRYNALGWAREVLTPAPGTRRMYHDEAGNVVRSVDRRGLPVTYAYDALGQVVTRTADGLTATFAYDSLGLWTAASNAEATDTTWFNQAGQTVKAVTWLNGQRYQRTYGYDSGARRTMMRVQTERGRDWYWDDAQHCSVLFGANQHGKQHCLNLWSVNYSYDTSGQLQHFSVGGDWLYGDDEYDPYAYYRVFNAGAVFSYNADRMLTGTTVGTTTMTRQYDRLHALRSITYTPDSVNAALGGNWVRDRMGRPLQRYNAAQTGFKWFDYDGRGQLQRFGTGVFAGGMWSQGEDWDSPFDRAGNPADSGAVVLPGNRLQSYRSVWVDHDADGNVISLDGSYKRSQFYWNSLGQLAWGNDDATQTGAEYGYDAGGRRVRRSGSSGVTYYLYDGENLLAEIAPDGAFTRVYSYYPGTDRPHAMVQNDSVYYYLTDEPGHVVGLVRPNGSLANRYDYTPFGELRFVREQVPNDLQYASRPWDDELSLYHMRARDYDPFLRRFISEDPIGLAGGVNLYAYARNSPVLFRDPFGFSADGGECKYVPAREREVGARQDSYGQWWKIQCPVIFVGGTGTVAIPLVGITVGVGHWTSGDEEGRYFRIGYASGLDASGGIEGGRSDSQGAFFGPAAGGCMSFLAAGGCFTGNPSGTTTSLGAARSLVKIPSPVTGHVEASYTFNLGSRPAPPPYGVRQFLRDAYNAITFQGMRP